MVAKVSNRPAGAAFSHGNAPVPSGLDRVRAWPRSVRFGALALLLLLVVAGAGIGAVTIKNRTIAAGSRLSTNREAPVAADGSVPSTASESPTAAPSATPSPPRSTGPSVPAEQRAGPKKGVSLCCSFSGASRALQDVRASWFYNWSADRAGASAPNVEFVPMIWGRGSVTPDNIAKAKSQGSVLLGFNEPDLAGQAEMSVTEALDLWPTLMATGMRLGSPAPAHSADRPGSWFDQFMSGARARGHRVDFIAVHWYGSDFSPAAVGHLKSYLQATHARYGLPIWLTEYSLINFTGTPKFPTGDQQAAFVRASTAMLESLLYVERYAWFALPSTAPGDTGLYRDANTPTPAGAAYRAAGAQRP
jgi:hypothetical protein